MRRTRQHVMEDASEKVLRRLLPDEWIVRPIAKDYGVDFEIDLVDQEIVSGNRIWVQLKSVEKGKRATARFAVADRFPDLASDGNGNICAEYLPFSMTMKEINYARRCHFPLLLVLVDLAADDAFWLPIRDEAGIRDGDPSRFTAARKSMSLRIPLWNSLTESPSEKSQLELLSFLTISRIEASLMNARALRFRFSKSLANRRQRLSHAKVLSTTHRLGRTLKPLTAFERLTMSTESPGNTFARA
jgi:hypothetical protein